MHSLSPPGPRTMRSYSSEFRLQAVQRILAGEKVSALSQELGIHRKLLYEWKHRVATGGELSLRQRGRPRKVDTARSENPAVIARLEQTIAHQQLIIEFFRHALQRVETERREEIAIGATASSKPSRR